MLLHMPPIIIVIPCYNEAARLSPDRLIGFLQSHPDFGVVLVNDGSTDDTAGLIDALANKLPDQVTAHHFTANQGKAGAVSAGVHLALRENAQPTLVGYLDADMSTPLEEMARLADITTNQDLDFVFGARIKKFASRINRSVFRHLAGRFVATIIDSRFGLGIYDTQCGAKLFRPDLAAAVFDKPFYTRWLYDIEIFLRIREQRPSSRCEEVPLLEWNDVKKSKLGVFQAGTIVIEINKLFKNYAANR